MKNSARSSFDGNTSFNNRNMLTRVGVLLIFFVMGVNVFAATYYSQGSIAPNLTGSWNSIRTGGGSTPANFTSGDEFVIQNGHNMTTSATWSVSGAGSKVWVENGGTLTATSAVTLAAATIFQIDQNGTYVHNNTNAYATSIFQGTESFDATSTVVLNNSNTTGPSSVTFGNLTINFTSDPGGSVNCAGGLTTVNGNLTIQSTSTREFRLTGGTSITLTILKDLIISGGTLNLASGTGAPTINIGGNFNQTSGTLTSSGSVSTIVFTGGTSSGVTFSTSGGTFTNTNINWQIAAGKTLANNTNFGAGSWVASSRTMTVNGTFQINQGSWTGNSGTWSYGSNATLIFNNNSGSYGVGNDAYWPTTNRPTNVSVQNTGGITMNVARTVSGTFQTAAGVTNGNNLTLNGTCQINAGGYFTGAPTYGSSSTLKYNTGGTYGRGDEWNNVGAGTIGTTSGYPNDVQVSNNTTLNLPNNDNSDRNCNRDLTIDAGSSLYADFGGKSVKLTVGRDISIAGNLSLGGSSGGDLYVGRHWTHTTGSFTHNSRLVSFNGSGAGQNITNAGGETFAYLTINNSTSSVTAAGNITVINTLTVNDGTANTDFNMSTYQLIDGGSFTTSGTTAILKSQNTSSAPWPSDKTWNFEVQLNGTSGQTLPTGTYSVLGINNAGYTTTAAGNITVTSNPPYKKIF